MNKDHIHLGFEVGTGKPVGVPVNHMIICGQTQQSGKTTTLEALIARSGLPGVAFVTKRGEQSFTLGYRIPPYFRQRADWQFVASVLEATMRERLKFERAWIIRASKGARTLADVQAKVKQLMFTAKGLSADVYLTLDSYLEIVVPRVAAVQFADRLDLQPGLNVLDLADRDTFPPELQALVMRSVLEWVYEKCHGTIAIIPEAWEYLPQGRGSPVKLSAVELIRKGAGLRNYVWLDSQDIGGIDKELLRSCPVWLLGVQRETNEIKRTLDNIPAGIAKPKPTDLATLEKGQFYACWGKNVIKVYVQPVWMNAEEVRAIAGGGRQITKAPTQQPSTIERPDTVTKEEAEKLRQRNLQLERRVDELETMLRESARVQPCRELSATEVPASDYPMNGGPCATTVSNHETIYQSILARLLKEPALLKLNLPKPELQVSVTKHTVLSDGETALGRTALLITEGYFDTPRKSYAVWNECKRRGFAGAAARMDESCKKLTEMGFLTKESDGFQVVPGTKSNTPLTNPQRRPPSSHRDDHRIPERDRVFAKCKHRRMTNKSHETNQ